VEGFLLQGVPQGVVVQLDQLGLAGATVDDTGRATGDAETAARTRTLLCALKSDEFHSSLHERAHRDQCDSGFKKALALPQALPCRQPP
jgi:hypothetical protein